MLTTHAGKRIRRIERVLALFGLALPLFAQYAGPAILSRGELPAALARRQIRFRPYFEIDAVYDSGLAGVLSNPQGTLDESSSRGVEMAVGLSGERVWRRGVIGLDYRGSLRHYTRAGYYDTGDQSLMFNASRQFTKHATLSLRETAGWFSRDFGTPEITPTAPFDPAASHIPFGDYFDNRTAYSTTQGDLTLQPTQRLSVNFGGDYFLTRRRSAALYGTTGKEARADIQYRLSRQSTFGVGYSYTHFNFTRLSGRSGMHALHAGYAVRLSEQSELSAYAGVMRVENRFAQAIPLDPIVSGLLSNPYVAATGRHDAYISDINVRFSEAIKSGLAYVRAGHTATPGNGVFLTSYTTTFAAGYTYTGPRRWSYGAETEFNRSRSVANVLGVYGDFGAGFTVTRQVTRGAHVLMGFLARRYDSPDFSKYSRTTYSVRLGVGFSPGDVPLRIW